jgi:hypothetical protein
MGFLQRRPLLVAGFIAAVTSHEICGILFRCGCTWLSAEHCNIHHQAGPHCPWCTQSWTFFAAITGWMIAAAVGTKIARRVSPSPWASTVGAILGMGIGALISGAITVAVTGYPTFLFETAEQGSRPRPIAVPDLEELGTDSSGKGVFGSRIAAVKKTKTGREIVVMDIEGKNRKRVTNNGSVNLLPAWSRDGNEILFTSFVRYNPNLYSIAASGDGTPKLLSGERGLNTAGVMSPDGKRIALTLSRDGDSEIYVMNSDGTGLTRLTNERSIDASPSWSPDGAQIAFVSSRSGDPHIFVMNADGSNVRRITDRGTYSQTPDWSPRGDLIAFTARDERNVYDIFTVNPTSKEIRRLTQDQGNNEEPSFSPDGSLIVFTSTREGTSQLWVMAADGSNQRRLTKAGGYSTPSWSPAAD